MNELKVEVSVKATGRRERTIERKRNDIITDTCVIDFEAEIFCGEKTYKVTTWYDTNEPYAYRGKERDAEFKSILGARREMSKRAIKWKERFENI